MIAGPDVRSAVHLVPPVLQNIGVGIAVRVEIENLVVLLAAAARPASGRPGPVDDNVARAAQPAAALQGFLIIRLQPVDRFVYRAVFDVIAVPVDHIVRFAVDFARMRCRRGHSVFLFRRRRRTRQRHSSRERGKQKTNQFAHFLILLKKYPRRVPDASPPSGTRNVYSTSCPAIPRPRCAMHSGKNLLPAPSRGR